MSTDKQLGDEIGTPLQLVDLLCRREMPPDVAGVIASDCVVADSMVDGNAKYALLHHSDVGTSLLARETIEASFRTCTIVEESEDGSSVKVRWNNAADVETALSFSWVPRQSEFFSTALEEMRRRNASKSAAKEEFNVAKASKVACPVKKPVHRVPTSLTAADVAGCRSFLDRHRAIAKASSLVALTNKLSQNNNRAVTDEELPGEENNEGRSRPAASGSATILSVSTSVGDEDFTILGPQQVVHAKEPPKKTSSATVFAGTASRRTMVGMQQRASSSKGAGKAGRSQGNTSILCFFSRKEKVS